ncbi:MAG: MoaD/ThiS family protein [Candidatus Nezhaarchaeales archaeon]
MKALIEFLGYASMKAGREWLWVAIEKGETLYDVFLRRLTSTLDAKTAESLKAAFLRGELRIAVNGRVVDRFDVELNDGDRILVFPMVAGG